LNSASEICPSPDTSSALTDLMASRISFPSAEFPLPSTLRISGSPNIMSQHLSRSSCPRRSRSAVAQSASALTFTSAATSTTGLYKRANSEALICPSPDMSRARTALIAWSSVLPRAALPDPTATARSPSPRISPQHLWRSTRPFPSLGTLCQSASARSRTSANCPPDTGSSTKAFTAAASLTAAPTSSQSPTPAYAPACAWLAYAWL